MKYEFVKPVSWRWLSGLCIAMALLDSAPAMAQSTRVAMSAGETWRVVSDGQLEAVRGGFDHGNGLFASFGLSRAIYVNGSLVSSSDVRIPDIAHVTPQQAQALAAATGAANVAQIGPGNSFDPSALNLATGAMVIQNTLDNQNLQSMTRLDVAVNNLNLMRSLDLQASLQSALIASKGP